MATLTILNDMAGVDFATALRIHQTWALHTLDLKSNIFGKPLLDLTDVEAYEAARLIRERNLSVHCLSTTLFQPEVEIGERTFRQEQLDGVCRAIELAAILKPKMIRLLAAQTRHRSYITDSVSYLHQEQPWVIPLYREAVDRIATAGFHATIENEVEQCIFSTPEEVVGFFASVDRPETVGFTWDVQNLWQCGTFPSLSVYAQLRPLVCYYHVKGGQVGGDGSTLCWSSTLEDASWPVLEITRQVVADKVSPVICINPSHGQARPEYDYCDIYRRDIEFLRHSIPEIK